jgi:hypothetical protein
MATSAPIEAWVMAKRKLRERERRKLDHLMFCDIEELTQIVAVMSADDCEKYARFMLDEIGGASFDEYLQRIVVTMMPEDDQPYPGPDDFYLSVRGMFPHIAEENDVLGRLCALVMQMAVLRLERGRERRVH